jgi:hypothetical protein
VRFPGEDGVHGGEVLDTQTVGELGASSSPRVEATEIRTEDFDVATR